MYKEKSIQFNSRISAELSDMVDISCNILHLEKRQFMEVAFLMLIKELESNNAKIYDIDLKEYATVCLNEKIRGLKGKIRNDHMSKLTLINRLQMDLFKSIMANATIQEVNRTVDLYYNQAKNYTDNAKLLKDMEFYRKIDIDKYKLLKKTLKERISNTSSALMKLDWTMKNLILEFMDDNKIGEKKK